MIDQSLVDRVESYIVDGKNLPVSVTENILDAYIKLIEQNAELHKELAALKGIDDKCNHQSIEVRYTHVECNKCHHIKTDGGWGVASRMWFENLEQAKFYESNGFIPK